MFWLTVYLLLHYFCRGLYLDHENRIWNGLFWDGTLAFLNEALLFIGICVSLNIYYLKWDTYGNIINSVSCIVFFLVAVGFVIVNLFVLNSNKIYQFIKNKDENALSKFFSVLSDLNFKRSGRKVMVYRSFVVTKMLVLVGTFVFLNDYPIFSIFVINFLCLISFTIIGYTDPFTDKLQNTLELMNECFVLLTIYHFFCFTDFVSDYENKDWVGISLIAFTVLNLGINLAVVCYRTVVIFIEQHRRRYLAFKQRLRI